MKRTTIGPVIDVTPEFNRFEVPPNTKFILINPESGATFFESVEPELVSVPKLKPVLKQESKAGTENSRCYR